MGADGALAGDAAFEVAGEPPLHRLVEVDLGDDHRAPLGRFDQQIAGRAPHARDHPVRAGVVGAGHEVNLVLDRPGGRQLRVAPPDRHGDDLRAVGGQAPRDLREVHVPADHHADTPEARLEDGVLRSGRHAAEDLLAREAELAVLADELAVRPEQHGRVVDDVPFAFVDPRDDV